MEKDVFKTLVEVNVNDKVEEKNTGRVSLKYLSWAWAWKEVKSRFPDASYEVKKFDHGLPYCYDPDTGYMVYTTVTIQGMTHEMWLPVLDSHNECMLALPREVKTRNASFTVDACTMFDVNKTIMRCLTKNLAMFGLGLYIYAGEDLPEPLYTEEELKESVVSLEAYINNGILDEYPQLKTEAKNLIKNPNYVRIQNALSFCKELEERRGAK